MYDVPPRVRRLGENGIGELSDRQFHKMMLSVDLTRPGTFAGLAIRQRPSQSGCPPALGAKDHQSLAAVTRQSSQSRNLPDIRAGKFRQLHVAEKEVAVDGGGNHHLSIVAADHLDMGDTVALTFMSQHPAHVIHYQKVSVRISQHDIRKTIVVDVRQVVTTDGVDG